MMIKKYIKKILPDPSRLKQDKSLKLLGEWLHDPNIWHLNKNSVANACSIGLFYAFVPVPFQMLLAAVTAIYFRANLALSVALVWITNPVTMPAIFYFAYRLGALLLEIPASDLAFEMSLDSVLMHLHQIWPPFLLGCGLLSIVSAIFGNIAIRITWRIMVIKRLKKRRMTKRKNTI